MNFLSRLKQGITSANPGETEACGRAFASEINKDSAIALSGNLGTGKTTFVRGLAQGMGLNTAITSPTYNIYTIYNGTTQLLHIDVYRLSGYEDLESLSIEEFLHSPFLIAVEWPERVAEFFHEYPTYWLNFEIVEENLHFIRLNGNPITDD